MNLKATQWYGIDKAALMERLDTAGEGLDSPNVRDRLKRYGPNRLEEEEQISKLTVALHQFISPLIYLLLLAALITFLLNVFRLNPISNPILFYSMITAFFAQLAVLYAPPLQWIFRTVPLTGMEWVQVITVSSSVLVVVELDKWLRRRF